VKLAPFAYTRAQSLEEALTLLAEAGPDAKLIAGGQSLVPVLAYRLVRPARLVDVDGVGGIDRITEDDGRLEVGALVRHAALERTSLSGAHRLLALAAGQIGHLPIRVRGTLGGSLAHADPAAELPAAALALDARVVARTLAGEREIPLVEFLLGPFTTSLAPDEMIVALRVPPAPTGARTAFREFALRAGDFALASAAVVVAIDDAAVVRSARVVVGAVGAMPALVAGVEEILVGRPLSDDAIAEASMHAAETCDASGRDLVAAVVREALEDVRAGAAA
jgi:carbon-monoxide dehydrogenase medium subunit/6-hydroxypseudooxynicotine dehydrogenase subunit alpha